MEHFQGNVSGIDVQAIPGQSVRSQTFISDSSRGKEIQVTSFEHELQTALEHAAARGVPVEVTFIEERGLNRLTRVRVLDR